MARQKEYSDDFNRSDVDPLNTDWDSITDWNGGAMSDNLQLVSNEMKAVDDQGRSKYNNTPGDADQYMALTVTDYGDVGSEKVYVSLRTVKSPAEDSYYLIFHKTAGTVYICRIDNAGYNVETSAAAVMADGDIISVEVETTAVNTVQIRMYVDGALKLSHDDTDATRKTANGYIAVKGTKNFTGDDFECGYLGVPVVLPGVKTINDLAIANVKTINDLAIASVKTLQDAS